MRVKLPRLSVRESWRKESLRDERAKVRDELVLPAPVGTQLVFDLHTRPMAMAMVLLQAMCDAAPERTQRRLEEFEATAARRHIFEA